MKKDLGKFFFNMLPSVNVRIVLRNNFNISSLFTIKDSFDDLLSARVVYNYKCPSCKSGQYVGSTIRNLHIRICEHKGVSFRTKRRLARPGFSAVRQHCEEIHGLEPKDSDFTILKKTTDDFKLRIIESILIKKLKPPLNNSLSSYPLCIY